MLGRERGELVDTIDIEIGGAAHDLCIDAVYYPLLAAVIAGYYSGMHAGIPCSKVREASTWRGTPRYSREPTPTAYRGRATEDRRTSTP